MRERRPQAASRTPDTAGRQGTQNLLNSGNAPRLPDVWGVLDELEKGPGRPRRQGLPRQHLGEGPVQGQEQARPQKEANRAHAKLRAPGERANAQLKTWDILDKLRCCPWKAGQLAKAIHVLQLREA